MGRSTKTISTLRGFVNRTDCMFTRADGEDLKPQDVEALEAYIKKTEMEQLSKEGLKAFFDEYAKEKAWEGIECPI